MRISDKKLVWLYEQGLSLRVIASELEVAESTLRGWYKKIGYALRPRSTVAATKSALAIRPVHTARKRFERWMIEDGTPKERIVIRTLHIRCIDCGKLRIVYKSQAGRAVQKTICSECSELRHRAKIAAIIRVCLLCKQSFVPYPDGINANRDSYDAERSKGGYKYCVTCREVRDAVIRYGIQYESVDRIKVFESDGWKCRHCGSDTPREFLGLTIPNAPTLDHILPRSKGGAHSYVNTQLLCHACNSRKSASIEREPRLVGVDLDPFKRAIFSAEGEPTETFEARLCDCGCGIWYIPFKRLPGSDMTEGNRQFKWGHWTRTPQARAVAEQFGRHNVVNDRRHAERLARMIS